MKTEVKYFIGLMFFLSLARLAVIVFMPLFDPSESRYAAIAANMAAHHDFLVPRYIHNNVLQSFDGKPPLLFQAGGLLCLIFGRSLAAVRLPSFIAALLLLSVLYRTASILRNAETARTAVIICATSIAFYALAGFCMTDMLLTLAVSGALLCHTTFDRTGNRLDGFAIFVFLGIGMLSKGPVAIVLYGLPAFAHMIINRRMGVIAQLPWISGLTAFLIITLPWYVLMARNDSDFLRYFFINENLLRFLVKEYGDKYGAGRETFRGMAIVWLVVVTLPWTPFAWKPVRALGRNILTKSDSAAFPATGIVCITLFWCLTSRVPVPYLLPVVPLFATWLAINVPLSDFKRFLMPLTFAPIILLPVIIEIAALTTDKFPGPFIEKAKKYVPENARFAFADRLSHSGEFHLGEKLDTEAKPENWLFIRTKNIARSNAERNRQIHDNNSVWSLLGPVQKDLTK